MDRYILINKSSQDLRDTPHTLDEASIRLTTQLIQLENLSVSISTRCIDTSPVQDHLGPLERFKKTIVSDSPDPSVSPCEIPDVRSLATGKESQYFFKVRCFPIAGYWCMEQSRSLVHSISENSLNPQSKSYRQIFSQWVQYRLRSTPI